MADIEKLTAEDRAALTNGWYTRQDVVKALRIIDAQAERIESARKILAEGRPVDSAESRLASDLREVLGG